MTVKCKDCDSYIDTEDADECAFCNKTQWCTHCLEAHEEACAESED